MSIRVKRFHDFSCGHRVVGHEGKCRFLHGHNYRVHFECSGILDDIGRVIDFSVIKEKLCLWLEDNWDHRMLVWDRDPWMHWYKGLEHHDAGFRVVTFNPTAENMAAYLLFIVGPEQLEGTGVTLEKVEIEETRKCSAFASLDPGINGDKP